MLKILKTLLVVVIVGVAYLCWWPTPVEPKIWQPSVNPGYTGEYSANTRLESAEKLTMGAMTGPEAAVLAANGDLIAASHEGWLVRFEGGIGQAEPWVQLGGRPLGLDIDADGNIWVANAYLGLQKVTPQGVVSLELNSVNDSKIGFADDLAITPNGRIYLSDATMRFHPQDWGGTFAASVLDIVEHGNTGRIIEYDPVTKQANVVLNGLSFANGVAADPEGRFILVNETGEYRVWKLWLSGAKDGTKEVLLSGLPGFPDNINAGLNGVFWLGLVGPRSADLDRFADNVFAREVIIRLPDFMKPTTEAYGMVVGINADGDVVHNLQAPSGSLYDTTGLVETNTDIYVTSLTAPFLAKVSKAQAGL